MYFRKVLCLKKYFVCRASHANLYVPSTSITDKNICAVKKDGQLDRYIKVSPNMPRLSTKTLRSEFIKHFNELDHDSVSPCSIFPKRNEGSYFINSGMNQFKSIFLSDVDSNVNNTLSELNLAVNSQPCIRIGGRLDDLNNVGFDSYHHTFFEMLGNWSFNHLDKMRACKQMLDFLCVRLRIPEEAIYVTYFGGDKALNLPPDLETRRIWLSLGIKDNKLMPFGKDHNFWCADIKSGGGLCGPSTEIHIDLKGLAGIHSERGSLRCARCFVNQGTPQVIELWNAVFITHRRIPSHNNQWKLYPLHKTHLDTGMGLERLAAIMQGVSSTYDTDIFTELIEYIHSLLPSKSKSSYGSVYASIISPQRISEYIHSNVDPKSLYADLEEFYRDAAYRIISDHSRTLAVSLHDGLLPGRQGLDLKLRQLIYRTARAAFLGFQISDPTELVSSTVALAFRSHKTQIVNEWFTNKSKIFKGPNAIKTSMLSEQDVKDIIKIELKKMVNKLQKFENEFNDWHNRYGPFKDNYITTKEIDEILGKDDHETQSKISKDILSSQLKWYGYDPTKLLHNFEKENPEIEPPNENQLSKILEKSTIDSNKFDYKRLAESNYESQIKPESQHYIGNKSTNEKKRIKNNQAPFFRTNTR